MSIKGTTYPKSIVRQNIVIDSTDMSIGRLSAKISHLLQGKHKNDYYRDADCGDYIYVKNVDKITRSRNLSKRYVCKHTGYVGHLKKTIAEEVSSMDLLRKSIKGMMQKNRLGRIQFKRLFLFAQDVENANLKYVNIEEICQIK